MRNLLPILVLIVGMLAVAAACWLLIAPENEDVYQLDSRLDEPGTQEPGRIDVQGDIENTDSPLLEPSLDSIPDNREVEKILPARNMGSARGGLRIHVIDLQSGAAFTSEELEMKVFYQEVPVLEKPKPESRAGDYVLENLLPGGYTVRAHTPLWERGTATALVKSGEFGDVNLLMSTPNHLQLQVVDRMDGKPIHNARVVSPKFIEGGVTDEKGLFRSERRFTPDSDMAIKITHPQYFHNRFEPLHPEKSGATRIGSGTAFRIPLAPRAGDLSIAGVVTDEHGEPLKRWALYLYPLDLDEDQESHCYAYTGTDGGFMFDRLSPGTYLLCATLRILMFVSSQKPPPISKETITLSPGTSLTDYHLVCTRSRMPFTGRVLRADTLEPAVSARIAYRKVVRILDTANTDPLAFEPMITDENGTFATKETYLPEDIFQLLVSARLEITSAEGISSTNRPVQTPDGLRKLQSDIIQGLPVTLWFTNEPSIQLTGVLLDAGGNPVPEARLNASSVAGVLQGRQRGFTDERGVFKIPYLFPGPWVITAQIPSGPTVERRVLIEDDGKPEELLIRLEHRCRLEGQLHADTPPSRVRVTIEGLSYKTEPLFLGPDLTFSFQHLPAGKAHLVIEAFERNRLQENYLTVVEDWIDLDPGRVVKKEIRL